MKIGVIITAGGTSSRFGNTNKLLEKINNQEIIKYTVEAFLLESISQIIICANKTIISELQKIFKNNNRIKIIEGGSTRQESVYNGLNTINCDYVLIHDGARPIITKEVIQNTIQSVIEKKAVSVMTKTVDTIKEVDKNGKIIKTLDRQKLYNTQTPQAFEYNLIKEAHQKLYGQNFTDDAGMLEYLGETVYILNGSYKNIKITTQNDIAIAKIYLNI